MIDSIQLQMLVLFAVEADDVALAVELGASEPAANTGRYLAEGE